MRKFQVLLLLALCHQVVYASSKYKTKKFSDVPSAKELDARLERIHKTLTAALENKAILRQGEDANAQENDYKIVLTEEERQHVNNIMKGIEEDNSNFEDVDRLNAILLSLNEKLDRQDRSEQKFKMQAQNFKPKTTMTNSDGTKDDIKNEVEDKADDIKIEDEE